MSEQYSIGNKFDLIEKISFEPLGCYYKAKAIDGEHHLLLLLNSEFSALARRHWDAINAAHHHHHHAKLFRSKINTTFLPVIDVIDFIEGVAILMPYVKVETLANFINKTKPAKLTAAKNLLNQLFEELSSLHKKEQAHGFINFSTILISDKKKIFVVGLNIFSKMINALELPKNNTELSNPRIKSCLSINLENQITCVKDADYYSMLVVVASLLQGYISSNGLISTDAIKKNISKKTRVYLTSTFCYKFCKNKVSIAEWMNKLTPPNNIVLRPLVTCLVAIVMLSSSLALIYNLWPSQLVRTSSQLAQSSLNLPTESGSELDDIKNFGTSVLGITNNLEFNKNTLPAPVIKDQEYGEYDYFDTIKNILSNNSEKSLSAILNQPITTIAVNSKDTQDDTADESNNSDNLKCDDNSCYDLISAGIKGPELEYTELENGHSLVMKQPILRNDYYIYCYIAKNCNLSADFDEEVMTNCLFGHDCTQNLFTWLNQPMEFISSHQVKQYISWLNNVTAAKYDIIPDNIWLDLATKLNTNQNCQMTKDKKFKVFAQREWVKIKDALAFRGVKSFSGDVGGCQITLDVADAESHVGSVLVRLIKNA